MCPDRIRYARTTVSDKVVVYDNTTDADLIFRKESTETEITPSKYWSVEDILKLIDE